MRTTRYVCYQKLTMCCRGRRRERVHCEKPVGILDGVCNISSKVWVGGRLRRTILMTLTGPSVTVVVHYYSRWMRWSAVHSRREATARVMRSSTREHSSRSNFARLADPDSDDNMKCMDQLCTGTGSGMISMLHTIVPMLLIDQLFPLAPELVKLLLPRLPVRAILP